MYNDTPIGTETPSQSQPLMRQNFQQIATSYNTDHVPLSSGTDVGFSNKTTYVAQTSLPTSDATHSPEYAKQVTVNPLGLINEIFIKRLISASDTEVQMTCGKARLATAQSGESFLPGGFQIKFGIFTGAAYPQTVTYSGRSLTDFPTTTLAVFAIPNNSGGYLNTNAIGPSSFSVANNGAGANFYWLAIGY